MFWKILSRTLHSIIGIGGLIMEAIGIYFDIVQATQTPTGPFGWSILVWGVILFTIASLSIIAQLWWHIHRIETPIEVVIKELESKFILQDRRYSMLEIFDALRDHFALGLTYPQIHDILKNQLCNYAAWGNHSSDILATFTTLGLIHSPSIDPSNLVLLDYQRTIPNYVYKLTDIGKLLAHKLMLQKPKIDKEDSQKK